MDPKSIPVTDANSNETNTEASSVPPATEPTSAPPVNMDVMPQPTDPLMSDESTDPTPEIETTGPADANDSEASAPATEDYGPVPMAAATNDSLGEVQDMPAAEAAPSSNANGKPAKKSSKTMIIAVAVGLAVVLAAVATLLFLKNKDAAKKTTASNTVSPSSQTAQTAKTPVTASEVDAATKQVDTTVTSLDNNKDFGADAMSDKSLGL